MCLKCWVGLGRDESGMQRVGYPDLLTILPLKFVCNLTILIKLTTGTYI